MKPVQVQFPPTLEHRLCRLYGDQSPLVVSQVHQLVGRYAGIKNRSSRRARWDEGDVVLIAYADQLRSSHQPPLATLREFLLEERWIDLLRTVHLLPFYPYSSDDGFSVIDYLQVDPGVGSWDDVERLSVEVELMFDLVLNHISQHSEWFRDYLRGTPPYDRFFIECEPDCDLSAVVRPRSLPLLTRFATSGGDRYLWTTFSGDQIDLNYSNSEVLLRMLGVLLEYVSRGARIIRLDAVAYLWKEIGTNCIHLSETHEIIKLIRDVLAAVAPHVLLLTETNVPHAENVSYFGDCDEAHMVYQFSLPPLLLDAFVNEDAGPITQWLSDLESPHTGTTYFNFTASHDGIGIRPLEGLVPPNRFQKLCEHVRRVGGQISTRHDASGSDSPYELNVTYVDALAPPISDEALHARRFLATQAVMLALQGVPAVYFHSLLGMQNDYAAVERSRQPRRINRRKYELSELRRHLSPSNPSSLPTRIYSGYRHLLTQRRQPAFHPDAPQRVVDSKNKAILAFERTSIDSQQRILVAVNTSNSQQSIQHISEKRGLRQSLHDLISGRSLPRAGEISLLPGQAVWLSSRLDS